MGKLVALVTAVALTGCTSYKNSRDVAHGGGAIILTTLVIGSIVADKDDDVSGSDAAKVMVPLILIGLALGTLGLVGMGLHKASRNDQPQIIVQPPMQQAPAVDPYAQQRAEAERRRRAAWDLTQQARVAAHQGDCQRVAYLATRVIEEDRATFDTVFSRDPFIIKCAPQPEQPRIPIPPLNPVIPTPQPPVEPPPPQ